MKEARFHLCALRMCPDRAVAQLGSAPALGAGGRRFESDQPDPTHPFPGFHTRQLTHEAGRSANGTPDGDGIRNGSRNMGRGPVFGIGARSSEYPRAAVLFLLSMGRVRQRRVDEYGSIATPSRPSPVSTELGGFNRPGFGCSIATTGGCSSMVELQPSKLVVRVRFPSPALR